MSERDEYDYVAEIDRLEERGRLNDELRAAELDQLALLAEIDRLQEALSTLEGHVRGARTVADLRLIQQEWPLSQPPQEEQ